MLAKQTIALGRHVLQHSVPSARDKFDPILDPGIRAHITKDKIPTTLQQRKDRDARLISPDRGRRRGRSVLPPVEEDSDDDEEMHTVGVSYGTEGAEAEEDEEEDEEDEDGDEEEQEEEEEG